MPLLSTLAAIATIAAAGTSTGLAVDSAVSGGPSAPKPTVAAPPTAAQQSATQAGQQAAVAQQTPTIEGLTSGYANPGYYAQQGALSAGVAGQPGGSDAATRAIEQAFGLPPGSIGGGGGGGANGPSTPSKPFTPTGVGDPSVGAFPTGTTDLSSYVNTFFRG